MSLTQAHVEIEQDHPSSQHKIMGINFSRLVESTKNVDVMHPVFKLTQA
jgi:hypothetical protein